MQIQTFAVFTLAAIAAGDLTSETQVSADCNSPLISGEQTQVNDCFTRENSGTQASFDSISPPETLDAQPLSLNQSFISVADTLPSVDWIDVENRLRSPISLINALLFDLTLSPIGALAFLLLLKRFLVKEIIEEALKRGLIADVEGQRETAAQITESLKADLESHLYSLSQGDKNLLNEPLNPKASEQNTGFKESRLTTNKHQDNTSIFNEVNTNNSTEEIIYFIGKDLSYQSEKKYQVDSSNLKSNDVTFQKSLTVEDCVRQGILFSREGHYEEAIACYDKALAIEPHNIEVWQNRGNILCLLQRYEEAIECYDKAIAIDVNSANLWYNKGNILARVQRYSESLECYDKAISIDSLSSDFWHKKGNILEKIQNHREAIQSYNKALEIKPDKYESWYNKGKALGRMQKYEESVIAYEQALQINPDKYEGWYNRGNALGRLHRYEEAVHSYEKAIALKPDNYEVWHNRAVMLGELQKYEAAIVSYERAIDINPNNYESWHNRGTMLEKMHHYEEAIVSYNTAIELNPERTESWYNCGQSLEHLHRYEEAILCYENALKIQPEKYEVWYKRGNILAQLQKYQEAIASFGKGIQIQQKLLESEATYPSIGWKSVSY